MRITVTNNYNYYGCTCLKVSGGYYKLVISGLRYQNLLITKSNIMAISVNIGELVVGTLGLVDHRTGSPVSASFSNLSSSSSDGNVFTVSNQGDDSLTVTAVGAGQASLLVTVIATYTDANTGQTVTDTKTLTVAVTVNVAPQQTDLVITFETPVVA